MKYKIVINQLYIYWFKYHSPHRLYGPALERENGSKEWYKKGKRHCLYGPAKEYKNGEKYWYIDDIWYTEEAFKNLIGQRYEI